MDRNLFKKLVNSIDYVGLSTQPIRDYYRLGISSCDSLVVVLDKLLTEESYDQGSKPYMVSYLLNEISQKMQELPKAVEASSTEVSYKETFGLVGMLKEIQDDLKELKKVRYQPVAADGVPVIRRGIEAPEVFVNPLSGMDKVFEANVSIAEEVSDAAGLGGKLAKIRQLRDKLSK